jgi:ankyrin repeat protein
MIRYFLAFLLVFICSPVYAMKQRHPFEGRTPLHTAACKGDEASMPKILKQGLIEYVYDEWGLVEIIEYKSNEILEIKDTKGQTALHMAAKKNRMNVSAFLLNAGADLEARDSQGRTPALLAAAHGRVRVLGFLLSKKAQKATTPEGKTLMHLAASAQRGDPQATVSFLLRCGMSVNVADLNKRTPLHDALLADASQEVVFCLLKKGANPDAQDAQGKIPRNLDKRHLITAYEKSRSKK